MKLTVFFFFVSTFMVIASETFSQKKTITIDRENALVRDILREIEDQSGYYFIYNNEYVDVYHEISIRAENQTVDVLLDKIFRGQQITYLIDGKKIIISPVETNKQAVQSLAVNGKVTDSSGLPLPGVTVVIKGTTQGTITDSEGRYSFTNVPDDVTLVFSFVGMMSQEVLVNGRTSVNVTMKDDVIGIEEVVTIGYGTVKKSDLTGAVTSVKGDDINNISTPSVEQMIQGRAAGVIILSNSGTPGGTSTVRIRGMGSVYGSNNPLYIIDGLPLADGSNLSDYLNPNDVEQIEVLKDASAAAIYGSRGANGVILITTKRGKASDGPKITFDAYYGMKKPWRIPETGNAAEYISGYLIGNAIAGVTESSLYPEFQSYYHLIQNADFTSNFGDAQKALYNAVYADYGEGTDWWDVTTQTDITNNYNISLNGGNEKYKYLLSFNYYDEKGIIKSSEFNRYTFRYNSDYKVNDNLKIGSNLSLVSVARSGIEEDNVEGGMLANITNIDPVTTPYRTPEETLAAGGDPNNPYDLFNPAKYSFRAPPLAEIAINIGDRKNLKINGNIFGEYKIIEGLSFKSNFAIDVDRQINTGFNPIYYISSSQRNITASISRYFRWTNAYNWVNQLVYTKEIGKHQFTVMGATEAYHWQTEFVDASKNDPPSNDSGVHYFSMATGSSTLSGDVDEFSLISYLGRLNYSFDNKYLITASFRRDGSSKFSEGNRWGNFSSFSLAYRLTEEEYFKSLNLAAISNLKLRGGWGQLGNQAIPTNLFNNVNTSWKGVAYPFGPPKPYYINKEFTPTQVGLTRSFVGSPDLTWETNEQINLGLDLGLFNNRVTFSGDYFIRTSKNNLFQVPVPSVSGLPNDIWKNAGKIENKGVELTAGYHGNVRDLSFDIGGNISFVKNEVKDIGVDAYRIYNDIFRVGSAQIIEAGHSMYDFFGYKTDGIFQSQAEIDSHTGSSGELLQPDARPGDIKFVNTNNDETLNEDDRVRLGSPIPTVIYGLNFALDWKGIEFSASLQGQRGNKILMAEKYYTYNPANASNSIKGYMDKAWHGPGTSNIEPIISFSDNNNNRRMSEYWLEDGAYLRMKSLQLAYNFPGKICNSIRLSSVKVYVRGDNVFTITKYTGFDPEMGYASSEAIGVSQYRYPQPKSLTLGLRVGF